MHYPRLRIIVIFIIVYQQDEAKSSEGDGDGEKKFDGSGYDKDLVEALERDILQKNPNVHWYGIILFFKQFSSSLHHSHNLYNHFLFFKFY